MISSLPLSSVFSPCLRGTVNSLFPPCVFQALLLQRCFSRIGRQTTLRVRSVAVYAYASFISGSFAYDGFYRAYLQCILSIPKESTQIGLKRGEWKRNRKLGRDLKRQQLLELQAGYTHTLWSLFLLGERVCLLSAAGFSFSLLTHPLSPALFVLCLPVLSVWSSAKREH